jgi:hypothetical protein
MSMRTFRQATRPLALLLVLGACSTGSPAGPTGASRVVPTDVPTNHPVQIVAEALRATPDRPLVDVTEITSGGPEPDGIPAIDQPLHLSAAEASKALVDTEQVLLATSGEHALAFPLRSLIQHEIANDILNGVPISATWCPLCNTGVVFDRRVAGTTTTFGVSGTLFGSAMVMYDRATRSLWTQPNGRAVVGARTGAELTILASSLLPWAEVRRGFPNVQVVLSDRGELSSATNPYEGYDSSDSPFLFRGRLDPRLPPFERVAGVSFGGQSQAWSFGFLAERRALSAVVGGQALLVLWAKGTSSPLDDGDVRQGREIGSSAVYDPRLGDRSLTLVPETSGFRDRETGTTWSLSGRALIGPLAGEQLRRLPSQDAFWFAWAAFNPTTTLVTG